MTTSNHFYQHGSGLLGLLITFGVIMVIMWYSFHLMTPGQSTDPNPVSDQATIIKAANQAKQLLEQRSSQMEQN